jgi:hypothetical protein
MSKEPHLIARCKNVECLKLFHVVPSDNSLDVIIEQLLIDRAAYGSSLLLELECPHCKHLFFKNTSSLLVCECGMAVHAVAE